MERRIKKSRGRPRIDPNLRFLNIRVTEREDTLLHNKSKETKIPICALIRMAIDEYLEKDSRGIDDEWEKTKDPDWEREK